MRADRTRLLDVTRLVSRAGTGPLTGVDRVELAYLRRFAGGTAPFFALCRTPLGFLLLDAEGAQALLDRVTGAVAWGAGDLIGRIARRSRPALGAAEADMRRRARARCLPGGLARMVARQVAGPVDYFNVGHSNLSRRSLQGLGQVAGLRRIVLIHDTIPLDYPQLSGPGASEVFAGKLSVACDHADLIICNSRATAEDLGRHCGAAGLPPLCVSLLGADPAQPDPAALPPDLPPNRPYFTAIGTIEPRKRYDLLLDIWEALARDMPPDEAPALVMAGSRGWRNEAFFARLEASPLAETLVFERPGLGDGALAALLAQSRGLIFPSEAEGFGLPLVEAANLNLPVITRNLPVYREFLGDYPVYVKDSEVYSWQNAIRTVLNGQLSGNAAPALPTWDQHFQTVLDRVSRLTRRTDG